MIEKRGQGVMDATKNTLLVEKSTTLLL